MCTQSFRSVGRTYPPPLSMEVEPVEKRNPISRQPMPQRPAQLPVCEPFASATMNTVRTGLLTFAQSAFLAPLVSKFMHGRPPKPSAE